MLGLVGDAEASVHHDQPRLIDEHDCLVAVVQFEELALPRCGHLQQVGQGVAFRGLAGQHHPHEPLERREREHQERVDTKLAPVGVS